jgi:salicylate hydroxylase
LNYAQYDELYQMLYKLALSAGAQVTFDCPVQEVSYNERTGQPRVVLQNGKSIGADIVIGADGAQSVVRELVNGEDDARDSGCTTYT